MVRHIFNYQVTDGHTFVDEESCFVPDQTLSIEEIFRRALTGALSDFYQPELPDDVPDYYNDLTDFFENQIDEDDNSPQHENAPGE